MRKFIGIDGGGTKTDMVLFCEDGAVMGRFFSGASNHQVVGEERAVETIVDGLTKLLQVGECKATEIEYLFAGLSGADLPSDFAWLNERVRPHFLEIPSSISNDTWIALSAAQSSPWGAVSICGTGHNIAHRTRQGGEHRLRGLSYEFGNWGGAISLTKEALHAAFRGEEHTGPATALLERIPEFLGYDVLDDLVTELYINKRPVESLTSVARLVFQLACEGDEVSIGLLTQMGCTLGEMMGRYILYNEPDAQDIPVVLAGSLYQKAECDYLRDAMVTRLKEFVPHATPFISESPPVVGACIEALRKAGRPVTEELRLRLQQQITAWS